MDIPSNGQMIEQGNDRSLYVRFFLEPVHNKNRSKAEGRPVYEDELFIEISAPADKTSVVIRPATDADKLRFPRHWAVFEKEGGEGVVGTPLKEWPLVSVSQIKEWNAMGIYTVEQLAGMSDNNVAKLMGGLVFREKARTWLAAAKEAAPMAAMQDELKKRDDVIAMMQRQIAELTSAPAADTKPAPLRARTGSSA